MKVEWWDSDVYRTTGGAHRLEGIRLYYDFRWLDVFPDRRAMFRNGKPLAQLVIRACPDGKTPALMLTLRDGEDDHQIETDDEFIFVLNLPRYLASARADAALTYLAQRIEPGLLRGPELQAMAENPQVIDAVAASGLTVQHIARWLAENIELIPELVASTALPDIEVTQPASAQEIAQRLRALAGVDAEILTALVELMARVPLEREVRVRFLRALAAEDGDAVLSVVREDPELLRTILDSEVEAGDIAMLARRRGDVDEFARLLDDDDYFESKRQELGGPEAVWQRFVEESPWVLGSSLAPQFLHAWSEERLEQTVKGFDIAGSGKRADAALRTAGAVSALVLAEIKHHRTPLLAKEYRPGNWRISAEVAGGVAQCQGTADEASRALGATVPLRDAEGYTTAEAFVCRPRTLLVLGSLTEFIHEGNVHHDRFQSFERFRRGLRDPEILTFDELYRRARLALALAEETDESES